MIKGSIPCPVLMAARLSQVVFLFMFCHPDWHSWLPVPAVPNGLCKQTGTRDVVNLFIYSYEGDHVKSSRFWHLHPCSKTSLFIPVVTVDPTTKKYSLFLTLFSSFLQNLSASETTTEHWFIKFRKLLEHVAKIVQVLSIFMPFVLYLLRASKRLKKIKIILKRLKEKIRKFFRSQNFLKKGTLQNIFSPCFYPEYYVRIYTKTATKHRLLFSKDWKASLILVMWFNYVILKVLYFWGLQ